jgi:hypothetical protein
MGCQIYCEECKEVTASCLHCLTSTDCGETALAVASHSSLKSSLEMLFKLLGPRNGEISRSDCEGLFPVSFVVPSVDPRQGGIFPGDVYADYHRPACPQSFKEFAERLR